MVDYQKCINRQGGIHPVRISCFERILRNIFVLSTDSTFQTFIFQFKFKCLFDVDYYKSQLHLAYFKMLSQKTLTIWDNMHRFGVLFLVSSLTSNVQKQALEGQCKSIYKGIVLWLWRKTLLANISGRLIFFVVTTLYLSIGQSNNIIETLIAVVALSLVAITIIALVMFYAQLEEYETTLNRFFVLNATLGKKLNTQTTLVFIPN